MSSVHRKMRRVWDPIEIGGLPLRNRIFLSGHSTNFAQDGLPTARHQSHYIERARGGVSLVVTEAIRVHPTGCDHGALLAGYNPGFSERFRTIIDVVHEEGARIFAQLVHPGRHGGGSRLWAPSALSWGAGSPTPHAMNLADIRELIDSYCLCATNAANAGFDGIEIHLGHGHLLQQFLSPLSNIREDEYGGSLENRLRLAIDILSEVRRIIPAKMILGARISADEFAPGGMNITDTLQWLPLVLKRVALDYVSVSQSHYIASGSLATQIPDMTFSTGAFLGLPREIKRNFPSLIVLGIGRVNSLQVAEEALASGSADMIGMTRSHIADPSLLSKWREGRESEIRPCLYCNQGCIGQIERQNPLSCVVNPSVGQVPLSHISRHAQKKALKVLVVGAGPGGLSAATTLAELGARVEIWESSGSIGGQLRLASQLPHRTRFAELTSYYQKTLSRLDINPRLNSPFSWDVADSEEYDHFFIACGAHYAPQQIAGFSRVFGCDEILKTDFDSLDRIVVVDRDGSYIAASVAETLALAGKHVTLLSNLAGFLPGVSIYSRYGVADRLAKLGVQVLLAHEISSGRGKTLDLCSTTSSFPTSIENIDAVVDTRRVSNSLSHPSSLDGKVSLIGDAFSPRSLMDAVHEGYNSSYGLMSSKQ